MIVEKEHLCIAVSDANQVLRILVVSFFVGVSDCCHFLTSQAPVGLIDMLDFCAFFNSEQVYHLDELAKKKTSELMSMSRIIVSVNL